MELWELVARESIRDTVARYAHCADRGKFSELATLFTVDGALEVRGEAPHVGRAAIEAFVGGVKVDVPVAHIRHHVTNLQIDVDSPREARGHSYFVVITQDGADHWGRYRDTYRAQGDRWLFSHRQVSTDGYAPTSPFLVRR